jgi:predicted dehydrogenase
MHYRGGLSTGSGFRWEIIGTDGELEITGPLGAIEMVDLTVRGSQGENRTREVLDVPNHYGHGFDLEVIPANVARLYEAFYNDLTTGSREAFSFDDAVRHHRVLAAIEEASDSGRRITI